MRGGLRLQAVDRRAAAEGLAPGLPLAEARARVPGLAVAPAEPEAELDDLAALAEWCAGIFAPAVAVDPPDGLILDVTGCAGLFGGEAALLAALTRRLEGLGLGARAALADTPGAAAVVARVGEGGAGRGEAGRGEVVPPGAVEAALAPLPVAGLRLPAGVTEQLEALGLRRIGDLLALPRAALARRFGEALPRRLDQVLGRMADPLAPRAPSEGWRERLALPEPIIHHEGLEKAIEGLLDRLCARLGEAGRGVRRLALGLFRVDGTARTLAVGTSRASRETAHLRQLLALRLEGVDLGLGVEALVLEARETEALAPRQERLDGEGAREGALREEPGDEALARLGDRLAVRHGAGCLYRLAPRESHIPERAVRRLPPGTPPGVFSGAGEEATGWGAPQPRPVRLLIPPEEIEAMALTPDAPPARFRWRGRDHRVARAEGPERIAPEWWRERAGPMRDYYRVEDEDGRRFWVFRAGAYGGEAPPRWYLHGFFA